MSSPEKIAISDAAARLAELVRQARDREDVVVLLADDSAPAAVLVSAERYGALLEEVEDLKDRLSVHERTGDTIPATELSRLQV